MFVCFIVAACAITKVSALRQPIGRAVGSPVEVATWNYNPDARCIGWKYALAGDRKRMMKAYDEAIAKTPKDPVLHADYAEALQRVNDNKKALYELDKAISVAPHYMSALLDRAYLHEKLGEKLSAIRDYSQALEVNPESTTILCWRARLKSELSDKAGAASDMKEAVRLDPTNQVLKRKVRILESNLPPSLEWMVF